MGRQEEVKVLAGLLADYLNSPGWDKMGAGERAVVELAPEGFRNRRTYLIAARRAARGCGDRADFLAGIEDGLEFMGL